MKEGHKIKMVVPGSIGDELELEPGDRVLAVNDQQIEDVFDYHLSLIHISEPTRPY